MQTFFLAKPLFSLRRLLIITTLLFITACTAKGNNPDIKRKNIDTMANQVLSELYLKKPSVKKQIEESVGYAVFSNSNIHILLLSASGGFGKTVYKKSGKTVYMKMAEAGLGLGLGVKDFRAVFIFHDENTLNDFVTNGWQFGGHADAALKSGDKGEAGATEGLVDDITIYQLTQSGVSLQATVKGTKYWKDDSLNK